MLPIAFYFLQVLLCSGLMMGYYWLVLRNKRFHRYNRFYLLMVLLLSWLVPLIKIRWSHPNVQDDPQVIKLLSVVADNNTQFENNLSRQGFQWNWDYLAMGIYLLLAGVLLVGMLSALYKIYHLLKTHSCKNVEDVYLVLTQAAGTPFSFFRFVFWNEAIDLQSEAGKQILVHELTHVREKHSFDKIFVQLVLIVGWFNPFFWLLKKEMDMIHEFIADDKAVKNGDTASLAQMLLTAAYPRQQFALTNPFFFSSIKRRLLMLTEKERPSFSYLRRLIVLPLLAIVVILFSFRNKEQRARTTLSVAGVIENVVQSVTLTLGADKKDKRIMVADNALLTRTYTVVIDAGHGGADKGAIAADGTTESSITLQLAKQIEAVNSNEKIHIVLRRSADVYEPVTRIADLANQQHPDLFISLHLNNSTAASTLGLKKTGFEYFIPSKEKASDYAGSQLLATTISSAMATLQKPSLGIKSRDKGIWVLSAVKSPAVLIELGFLSNKEELKSLKDADYQAKLANTILNGINDYLVQSSLTQAKNTEAKSDTTPAVWVNDSYYNMSKLDTPHYRKTDTMVLRNVQSGDIQSKEILKGDKSGRSVNNSSGIVPVGTTYYWPAPNVTGGFTVGQVSNNATNTTQTATYIVTPISGLCNESSFTVTVTLNPAPAVGIKSNYISDKALIIVDGIKMDKSFNPNSIIMSDIRAINWYAPNQAKNKYGEEAQYGASEIFLKEGNALSRIIYPAINPNIKVTTVKHGEPIFTSTEIPAEFPGGNPAWEQYLLRNLNSGVIKDKGGPVGKYTVVVSFLVDKEGNISSVQALNDPGYGAKAAAENLIIKSPRWKPAVQNGQLVNNSVKRTISFEVK